MASSHDRWFLDRIATHILAFEGDSKVVWFEGNYSEYEADRRKRLGKEADRPHRIRYRKLTREAGALRRFSRGCVFLLLGGSRVEPVLLVELVEVGAVGAPGLGG